jgi:hypothetical protein
MRQGECRIETFRNKLRVIIGNYERDKLHGKAKVSLNRQPFPFCHSRSSFRLYTMMTIG